MITHGEAFNIDGDNVLHAYDLNPGRSLNGMLQTVDNGIPDFGLGYPYDEIWELATVGPGWVRYSTAEHLLRLRQEPEQQR